ncbi:MAG: hypothetical protein ACXW18_01435 [Pyrinomonadaceae bacterium]
MACPTIEEFKELLRREAAEKVAEDHVFGGDLYIGQTFPRALITLRRHLCPRFRLKEENVIIIGSAKIGFSLDPNSFPRRFTNNRDIDVLVVSETLFDTYWHAMLRWHYPRRLQRLPQTDWNWVKSRQSDLYWGWFHPDEIGYGGLTFPDALKPLRDLKTNWFNAFKKLSLYEEFFGRDVNGRLYRTWEHALLYQASGLRQIQTRLIQGDEK